MPSTTITREGLFDLVWSQSMRSLAVRFGISDVALAKRCRKLRIPVPGRGFWARVAAGHRDRRPTLPAPRTAVERSPIHFAEPPAQNSTPPPDHAVPLTEGPVWEQQQFESLPQNRIVARKRLSRSPLIHATARSLADHHGPPERRTRTYGDGTLDVAVAGRSARRALLLLDSFVQACAARGFVVEGARGNRRESRVTVLDQHISFRVFESERRIDLTKDPGYKPNPRELFPRRYRHEGTGVLDLQIGSPYGIGRSVWIDYSDLPLEEQLNEVMVGLVAAAVAIGEWQTEREREEEEHRRLAAIARAERVQEEAEERRVAQLVADAERWARAEQLRNFATAMEAELRSREAGRLPVATHAWLAWVHYVADELDPAMLADPVAYLPREPVAAVPAWGGR